MEHKGTYHGAEVYDDYAHHPGELHALLTTARTMGYQRVICAFQPHTYSRTKALFSQFVEELKLPDVTVLAEIYAAREPERHRHLLAGSGTGDPRRHLLLQSGEGDGYAGLFGPARRPDPDGGGRRYFPGRGKAAGKSVRA